MALVVCDRCGQVLGKSGTPRGARCGQTAAPGSLRLRAYAHLPNGDVRASVHGVYRCNNGWGCPDCAYAIQARDREVLQACNVGFRSEFERGEVYMVTLTTPHRRGDTLRPLRTSVLGAYQKAHAGRPVAKMRADFGIVASVRRLEVNDGTNSWHPHIHAMLFCRRKLTDQEVESLREWYFVHYGAQLEKRGRTRLSKSAIVVTVADKDGAYLAKMGLLELAGDMQKRARCSGCRGFVECEWRDGARRCLACAGVVNRNPWQILVDYHEHGETRDKRRFAAFRREIAGARRLTWSRWKGGINLRDRYCDTAPELELPRDSSTDLVLPREAWLELRRDPDRVAAALDAFETGDRPGLEKALGDWMPAAKFNVWDAEDPRPLSPELTPDERLELREARRLERLS